MTHIFRDRIQRLHQALRKLTKTNVLSKSPPLKFQVALQGHSQTHIKYLFSFVLMSLQQISSPSLLPTFPIIITCWNLKIKSYRLKQFARLETWLSFLQESPSPISRNNQPLEPSLAAIPNPKPANTSAPSASKSPHRPPPPPPPHQTYPCTKRCNPSTKKPCSTAPTNASSSLRSASSPTS